MMFLERHKMNEDARSIAILFASFILSCGLGHLVTAWNIWHTDYWLEGSIKLVTATISAYTAIELYSKIPLFLSVHKRLEVSEQKVQTDELTGMPNRRALNRELAQIIEDSNLKAESLDFFGDVEIHHALLLADLDGFKSINDNFGHPIGDLVLQEIAKRLLDSTQMGNISIARLGGDEFAALISFCNEDKVLALAQEIRTIVCGYADSNAYAATLGISIGFQLFSPGDPTVKAEEIYAAADRALYHAKESGKGKISWTNPHAETIYGVRYQQV
ncbi:MAG: GGDEF domain-containing protein [Geitlerinemataceae cyanobacterium]